MGKMRSMLAEILGEGWEGRSLRTIAFSLLVAY